MQVGDQVYQDEHVVGGPEYGVIVEVEVDLLDKVRVTVEWDMEYEVQYQDGLPPWVYPA